MRLPVSPALEGAVPSAEAVDRPGDVKKASTDVIRGAVALLSTQPLTWACSLATLVLVPRYLGADGLGRYAVATAIAALVGTVATVGLPNFITRRIATDAARAANYAWGSVVVVIVCSALVGAVALASIVLLGTPIELPLATIAILAAVLSNTVAVLMAVLVGLGRHARYAWSNVLGAVVGTTCGLAALAIGGDVVAYAATLLVASTGTTVLIWATSGLRPARSALDGGFLRQLVVGGLPFLGWNVASRVRADIDVVLTGILLQSSVAGWLAAAYRIINITVFIPTVIVTPLLPALSRSKGRPDVYRSVLGESLATVLLLTVPVSAGIFALAPSIPTLLDWPDEFQHTVPLIMLLAFQQTLIGVDMVLGAGLVALGLERPWLAVAVAGALFNPLLNLVAIPFAASVTGNGAIGAAIVELATELLFLTGAIRLTPRHLIGSDNLTTAMRIVVAGLVMLAVAISLRPYGPVLALGCGGAAYIASAFALGVLKRRHIKTVRVALRLA